MAAQSALVRFQASSALSPNDMARPFNARSIFKSWVRSANLQPFVVVFSVATIGWIQR